MIDADEVARWVEDCCPRSQRTPVTDPAELFTGGSKASFASEDAAHRRTRFAAARGYQEVT